jgi:hypothetical protein
MKPVGTAKVYVAGERLEAVIDFAPLGASNGADEIHGGGVQDRIANRPPHI